MFETKTLYTWDSRAILRLLNTALEKLAVLDAAGVTVPIFEVRYARDDLLKALTADVRAEVLPVQDNPVPVAAE